MTSIFDRWTDLDPALALRRIEAAHGSAIFDRDSYTDPQRAIRQIEAALGIELNDVTGLQDPRTLEAAIDEAVTGGGVNDYVASGVHFGGVSFLSAADLVIADSPVFSWVFYFRVADPGPGPGNYNPFGFGVGANGSSASAYMNIASTEGNRSVGNDNYSADGVQEASFDTSHGAFEYDQWVCCMSNMDMSKPAGEKTNVMVLNDVVYLVSNDDFSDGPFSIAFSGAMSVGATATPSRKFTKYVGDIADVWLAPGQLVDFTIESNRRKFVDASGKPKFLGSNGQFPTGTAPAVFCSGDATEFLVNRGTVGDVFSLRGSIRAAGSSGAGPCAAVGAVAGTAVASVIANSGTDLTSKFETTISVNDQIQQTSSDDLSTTGFTINFATGTLTNATTSPSD